MTNENLFAAAWQAVLDAHHASLEHNGIVGCSLLLARRGTVTAEDHFGLADQAAGLAAGRDVIYHWASITKTFTGIAVMQLRDRGRLDLDAPIVAYLPELRQVHNPFGPMEAVTLRHLMGHTSGFRQTTWPWGGDRPWHPPEPQTWAQLAAMMPYSEIAFAPGSRYGYSNPAVIFLGRVVELLTGDDIEVYVDKNILKPLGMFDTYFDRTPYHLLPRRADSYLVDGATVRAAGRDFDTGITAANGGLNAPLSDLRRFLSFLAGEGGADVLARASLEEMWTPRAFVADRGPYRESCGLSFFVLEGKGLRVAGHTGTQQGFVSFLYVEPESGLGVAAVYNTVGVYTPDGPTPPDTRRLSHALRQDLLDRVFPLFR